MGVCEHRRKFYQGSVAALLTYAEHTFKMMRQMPDGASDKDHRESAAAQIAKIPGFKIKGAADIMPEAPPFPYELTYLWNWFTEIASGLQGNGWGAPVVTWEALRAWAEFMRVGLEPWEASALIRVGLVRADALAPKVKKVDGGQGKD
jgi:hypothetical protein